MEATIYQLSSGKILRNVDVPDAEIGNQYDPTICGHIAGTYRGNEYYAPNGVATARPSMPVTVDKTSIVSNGTDTATISGIPSGAEIFLDQQFYDTADGNDFPVTSAVPKTFKLEFRLFPYLPEKVTINATA